MVGMLQIQRLAVEQRAAKQVGSSLCGTSSAMIFRISWDSSPAR